MNAIPKIDLLLIIMALLSIVRSSGVTSDEKVLEPEIILDHGTKADAQAALKVLQRFLDNWEARKYSDALKEVHPALREGHKKEMKNRSFKLQRVEDIKLSKRRDVFRARIHVAADPSPPRADRKKRGIGIDMIFIEGRWWIAGG